MDGPRWMSRRSAGRSSGSSSAVRPYTPGLVADLPVELPDGLDDRLSSILDVEGKIPRALESLGPVAGREVLVLGAAGGLRAGQLRDLGASVVAVPEADALADIGDASADVIVSFWASFRGDAPAEVAAAERILRPGGRLLLVHDYGRDDVSHLNGERPEYGPWSKRNGPFLSKGFKVRVIHCFWTFESMEDCAEFLAAAFDQAGRAVAAGLKRPRLSYNVAVYHRTFGEAAPEVEVGALVAAGDAVPTDGQVAGTTAHAGSTSPAGTMAHAGSTSPAGTTAPAGTPAPAGTSAQARPAG